ncbi:hypothetical protein [Microbacterium sp. GCS4]|uniref:hypothetical protein n=1 Tax=Microbacterium sp. GCS4 TaxID=1692239 RepID=UPI000B32FA18|nr:hypothetical protein [Microbacterium sp. GCS4]
MKARAQSFRVPAAIPGIVPRLLVVAFVAVGALVLMPFPLWQGIAIVLAVASVLLPVSMAAWGAAACLPFGVLLGEPSIARTALAVLLVHAIHVCAGLSLVIPVRSRLSLRVLGASLRRLAVIQLISQPLALGIALLSGRGLPTGVGWVAPIAAAALVLGIAFALRSLRRADIARDERISEVAPSPGGANVRGPS